MVLDSLETSENTSSVQDDNFTLIEKPVQPQITASMSFLKFLKRMRLSPFVMNSMFATTALLMS
jgi:hypothetical protein